MKKILPLFLVLITLLLVCSCGGVQAKDEKFSITATIFPQYDFLREITKGADIKLDILIPAGKEIHGFEATLSDVARANESDLFVYVGGEDDEWIEKTEIADEKKLSLTELVPDSEEHMWTSPKNAMIIVKKLGEKLAFLNPENAEIYKKNTEAYLEKLAELDADLENTVADAEHKTLVFGDRFPFAALAKDYSLEFYSAFEGCSTETEAGIKTVNFLINKINEEKIPAVLVIEFSNLLAAEKISEQTGAEILKMHSCHNVTQAEFDSGETYLSLMEKNLEVLKKALG